MEVGALTVHSLHAPPTSNSDQNVSLSSHPFSSQACKSPHACTVCGQLLSPLSCLPERGQSLQNFEGLIFTDDSPTKEEVEKKRLIKLGKEAGIL